jgi:hypothetical protein
LRIFNDVLLYSRIVMKLWRWDGAVLDFVLPTSSVIKFLPFVRPPYGIDPLHWKNSSHGFPMNTKKIFYIGFGMDPKHDRFIYPDIHRIYNPM